MKRILKSIAISMLLAISGNANASTAPTDSIFKITGDHGQLQTRLQLPEASGKIPMVVLCHGFMGNMGGPLFDAIADNLLANGIGVVRFDFNGHGNSEGRFQDMTVPNEVEDAKKIVEWTEQQPFSSSVSLAGHSQGGVVAAVTAGQIGYPRISSVVLLAPAAVLRDDAIRGILFGKQYPADNVPETIDLFGDMKLGRNYVETARVLPIYETASLFTGPAFILHGTADRVVPYTYGERFAHDMPAAHVKTIAGEDHGFSKTNSQTAQDVANWFHNILKTK